MQQAQGDEKLVKISDGKPERKRGTRACGRV
jgi:hypothetical protein